MIRRTQRTAVLLALGFLAGASPLAAQERDDPSLRPGDALRISVWPDPENSLSGEFIVEDSGLVYLPYLGAVRAAGISLNRLREELRQGYIESGRPNAVVSIVPLFRVGVLGDVRQPGIYRVSPSDGLFDVIGMAGGFGGTAKQEEVRVVRDGQVVEVDAYRALATGEMLPIEALTLRSGDNIVVPSRGGGVDLRTVLTLISTAATVAFAIDRLTRD